MQITAVCCTYLRPAQLGHLLRCFEQQTHAERELVILDDAGQYENQCGDRWRLVSTRSRFRSLAEKRNAAVSLVPRGVEALAVWDDDDLYLPWALAASAAALERAEWSRPSIVLQPLPGEDGRWRFRQHRTGGLYHGGWAFRRAAFDRAGGYPAGFSGPEDQELMKRLERQGTTEADPIALGWRPFYVYTWGVASGSYHISGMLSRRDHGDTAWKRLGRYVVEPAVAAAADPPWFDLADPPILPGVHPRPF